MTILSDAYNAVKAANPSNTSDQNLALVNAMTTSGGMRDVTVSSVVALLALNLVFDSLKSYATSPPNGANPDAVTRAKNFIGFVLAQPQGEFSTSNATIASALSASLATLALDGATHGVTAGIVSQLEALWSVNIPLWQADGKQWPYTLGDLQAQGLA